MSESDPPPADDSTIKIDPSPRQGGRLASIAVSEKLKQALSDLKAQQSSKRKVTWNELIEMMFQFYLKKDQIELELDQLQKAVTQIAIYNAKYLGERAGVDLNAHAPPYTSPSPLSLPFFLPITSPSSPAPHMQQSPEVPNGEGKDLQKEMVAELNRWFDSGGVPLKSVQDAIEEELRQHQTEIIAKTAAIISDELAQNLPVARELMQKLISEQGDRDGTIFVIAKNVILELKKVLKSGTEDLATEADSLKLLVKQDSSSLQADSKPSGKVPSSGKRSKSTGKPLANILKEIAKIREMVR